MTIASEIQRIQTNIANAYDALELKGATMPATENTDNLVTTIGTISSGGDVVTATNNTGSAINAGDKVWINESSGSYIIENLPEFRNFNVIGNPTINDNTGVVSGFSTSNYLKYNNYPTQTISELEILCKIRTPNSFSKYPIALSLSNGSTATGPQIQMNPQGYIFLVIMENQSVYSSEPLLINKDYWVKMIYNNSTYEGLYSTDNINWVSCGTISLPSIQWSSLPICFGGTGQSDNNIPWLGLIYIKDCYININGFRWWEPYLLGVTENSLSGFAKESISSGSTGTVETILPE